MENTRKTKDCKPVYSSAEIMEGYYSAHGSHPGDLLEIAGADAIPETVTIGKLLDDDTPVRIY